jgi:hypothetical protein
MRSEFPNGTWSELSLEEVRLDHCKSPDAFKIRRIYRKLAKRKDSSSPRRITVFVRHENVLRLLEFLGYCRQ